MRLEATVPDVRGTAVIELAEELGLSRSQVIDEALTLYLAAVREVRSGRRLVAMDPVNKEPIRELVMPALAALEWATHREGVAVDAKAGAKLAEVLKTPPAPPQTLRKAMKRRTR